MNIDRDDEYATRYEAAPTIEEQIERIAIKTADSITGCDTDTIRQAIRSALYEYRCVALDSQPVTVEPVAWWDGGVNVTRHKGRPEAHGWVISVPLYPQSAIDSLQSAQKLAQEERDAANDKALRVLRGQFTQICSYCGWEANREGAQWTDLQSHIKQCEHHPLVKAESLNRRMVELMKRMRLELWYCNDQLVNGHGAHEGHTVTAVLAESAELLKEVGE